MKYCVENDLSLFEFHDAIFSFVGFDGKDMVVSARHLNIHKDTEPNPADYDMEIECAQITFKGFRTPTYEPGRVWKTGADGNSYPVGPRVVFSEQEAQDRILEELQHQIWVYYFEKKDNGKYYFDGCGEEPYFTIEFDADGVTVCWDQYIKKAWYELHRQYRYDSLLHTPKGDEAVQLTVICHEETVYINGVPEESPTVNVGCKYEGNEYWGHGSDYLWMDAFADLQRQLPAGVSLKCCLTCRHGNLCPVGNEHNELFCTRDAVITQKSDLYFYTEDRAERHKRTRQYCQVCEDYRQQCEDYYTYNDFLCFLNQE